MSWRRFTQWWRDLGLVRQFVLAGGLIMIAVTIPSGMIITNMARENALFHRAVATVLFMDNVVARQLQPLADGPLPVANRDRLDALLESEGLAERVPYLEVWLPDGSLAYTRSHDLYGQSFDLPEAARQAFEGTVEVTTLDLTAPEHTARLISTEYLEIYAPLHDETTGAVIAVMELHESLEPISATVRQIGLTSWAIVSAAMLALFASMYGVVRGGAAIIERQKRSMATQLAESRGLAERNAALHRKANEAAQLKIELHENLLRTIGSDLHDGPSQILAYASLKVEGLKRAKDETARLRQLDDLEQKLRDAQDDIRDLATGFVLPNIEKLDIKTVVSEAIANGERRLGVIASVNLGNLTADCSIPAKICLYRFFQEGLNNVWNHGKATTPHIEVEVREDRLLGSIRNEIAVNGKPKRARRGFGIRALKVRAESLGGEVDLTIHNKTATLTLQLPLRETIDA